MDLNQYPLIRKSIIDICANYKHKHNKLRHNLLIKSIQLNNTSLPVLKSKQFSLKITLQKRRRKGQQKHYLAMNQISPQRIEQEVPGGGTGDNDAVVSECEPLKSGDWLCVDGGEVGSDLEGRGGGGVVGPWEEEDGGAVGDEEGMGVDGAEEVRGFDQPVRFSRSELAQFIARYATQLRLVRSLRHGFWDSTRLTEERIMDFNTLNHTLRRWNNYSGWDFTSLHHVHLKGEFLFIVFYFLTHSCFYRFWV